MKKITANDAKTIQLNDGQAVTIYAIKRDTNGNPRAVVHFTELGLELEDFGNVKGLGRKYTGKDFGGGYVFQSYDAATTLHYMLQIVKEYKAAKAANA